MPYALKYDPDSDLGRKFTQVCLQTYDDQTTAERVRDMCPNHASIVVVEVEDDGLNTPVKQGETVTIGVAKREPDRANESDSLAPSTGTSRERT